MYLSLCLANNPWEILQSSLPGAITFIPAGAEYLLRFKLLDWSKVNLTGRPAD